MSQLAMPTPRSTRITCTRRASVTNKASMSDDEDAITPCSSPPPEPQDAISHHHHHHHHHPQQYSFGLIARKCDSSSATSSSSSSPKTSRTDSRQFDPTEGQEMDDCQLWQRMLDIQRTFHCYNSARMSAALLELEMGVDAGHLAPSRSCLDLMNESVSAMSAEERQRLSEWLHAHPAKRRSAIWKRSSVFGSFS